MFELYKNEELYKNGNITNRIFFPVLNSLDERSPQPK